LADGCGGLVYCGPCPDASPVDAGLADAALEDVQTSDVASERQAVNDAGMGEAFVDASLPDAAPDSGPLDSAPPDLASDMPPDASVDAIADRWSPPDAPSDRAAFDAGSDTSDCQPWTCADFPAAACERIGDGCGGTSICASDCGLHRGNEPVILTGTDIPGLAGILPDRVRIYSWHGDRFAEVASQVDERVQRSWSEWASELSYVFDNWGDGMETIDDDVPDGIDGDDEIAFLASAAALPAPEDTWVEGADPARYEIFLTDPLSGRRGAVYLFTFPASPPASPELPDVEYERLDTTTDETAILTEGYRAHYANRWALDEISIRGCGHLCSDMIDRVKGRAGSLDTGETEDDWAASSRYVGDLTGPVRAIREIKGAASGEHTTYVAEFYADRIVNTDYLRVHAIQNVWRYFDYNQTLDNLQYSDAVHGHVHIDGSPDAIGTEYREYFQVTSFANDIADAQGSLVHLVRLLDMSALLGGMSDMAWYQQDDAGWDDTTGDVPPGAWGNAGIHALNVCVPPPSLLECQVLPDQPCCPRGSGSESHPLIPQTTTVVLPPAASQEHVADIHWQRLNTPLQVQVTTQPGE